MYVYITVIAAYTEQNFFDHRFASRHVTSYFIVAVFSSDFGYFYSSLSTDGTTGWCSLNNNRKPFIYIAVFVAVVASYLGDSFFHHHHQLRT